MAQYDFSGIADVAEPDKPLSTLDHLQSGTQTVGEVAAPLGIASRAWPMATNAAIAFSQSPTAAQTGSALARGATTLSGVVHGAVTMNPSEVLAAPRVGWAAGKGGYWLTKGAQAISGPIADAMKAAEPYIYHFMDPVLSAAGQAQAEGSALRRLQTPEMQKAIEAKRQEFNDWLREKLGMKD